MKPFLLIALALISITGYAFERRDLPFGPARVVYREFSFTPKECLAKMPTGTPRQIWKCVVEDPAAGNTFSFNPALEFKETGRPYGAGIAADIRITFETLPRGGTIAISAPDATHPGYSRMISYDEMRHVFEAINQAPARFHGTYLVAP